LVFLPLAVSVMNVTSQSRAVAAFVMASRCASMPYADARRST